MTTADPRYEALIVPPEAAGERLDRLLARAFPEVSRARFQALIAQGAVTVGGRTIGEARHRVKPGDEVAFTLPPAAPARPRAEAMALSILFEDADLLVLDKPAGLAVHPGAGRPSGTLVNALIAHCGESLSGISGEKRPGIVHRLDKDTSGLLVVAKSERALKGLQAQFAAHGRDKAMRRAYLAFVWGCPERAKGRIEAAIGRHPQHRTRMAVRPSGGRRAVTRYEVVESYPAGARPSAASLVRCELETGRTHQIRVHMAHIGHPLLGDQAYGRGFAASASRLDEEARKALSALGRQALHAAELSFRHPVTGEDLRFRSPLPPELERLRTRLRKLTQTS
jgi:23S rRNA pseudouridine1911/1915/1917 synthase